MASPSGARWQARSGERADRMSRTARSNESGELKFELDICFISLIFPQFPQAFVFRVVLQLVQYVSNVFSTFYGRVVVEFEGRCVLQPQATAQFPPNHPAAFSNPACTSACSSGPPKML